ncbi:MAG: hypothetical protein ACI3YJ_11050, partial [Prevotella sp.]
TYRYRAFRRCQTMAQAEGFLCVVSRCVKVLWLASFLMCSCTKEGDILYWEDVEKDERPFLYFVLGEDKMGDRTYYDELYRGASEAAMELDCMFSIDILRQSVGTDPKEKYSYFLDYIESVSKNRRMLVVIGNDNFEPMLHELQPQLEELKEVDFLLVESKDTTMVMHTIYFPLCGACYQAGRVVRECMTDVQRIAMVRANPSDIPIKGMAESFREGYMADGFSRIIDDFYLQSQSGGYEMSDSTYRMSYALDSLYQMVIPLCGSSQQGFLRYNREHAESFYTVGLDADLQSYSRRVPFSMVKHISSAVKEWITQWYEGREMPRHQLLGLETGYTEVVVSENYKAALSPRLPEFLNEAILKEKEYESAY